ncbi:MAG: HlyD family type I secretion periplasmic adaptor subunit, partial [Pseudomonadota bacterium]
MLKDPISDDMLALPLDLESGQWARLCDGILKMGCLFVASLLILAAIGSVRELAIAEGQLVTAGAAVRVEHLEGGTVAEILVQPGEIVANGAALIRIAPLQAESELAQIAVRHAHLTLVRERLRALLDGRAPDFENAGVTRSDLIGDQHTSFMAELAALTASETAMEVEIRERRAEITAAQREVESGKARVAISHELLDMQGGLLKKGHSARNAVLEAEARLELQRTELAEAEQSLAAAKRAVEDAVSRGAREAAERTQAWSAEIAQISGELAEIEQTLRQRTDRVDRLLVRSPVHGIVHELLPQTRGEVLVPGDQVATIIPVGEAIEAEVRIAPADIGHVAEGDPAEVSVTAFDEGLFGTVTGTIVSISPTTFQSTDDTPFYRARVALEDYS